MKKTAMFLIFVLAAALVIFTGCERKVVVEHSELTDAATCFTCHSDDDGRILSAQGQWLNSVHASGDRVQYTNRGGFYDCTRCHDHQGFVDFITTGELNAPYDMPSAIHCFTCHAPHTNGNLNLRTEAAYTLDNGVDFDHGEGNLCANCHHARYDASSIIDSVEVSAHWGPHHGPQSDMLQGTNGYEYADFEYHQSPHKTAIPNACVGCHMAEAEIFDGYKVGGHSWNMVDEETGTNLAEICTQCHEEVTDSYDFPADSDYDHDGDVEGVQTEVQGLIDSLATLLSDAGILDEDLEPIDTTITDPGVVGAVYNYVIVNEDRSFGVHNFNYIVGLLQSAIEYMNSSAANSKNIRLLAAHARI